VKNVPESCDSCIEKDEKYPDSPAAPAVGYTHKIIKRKNGK
jgi:hypothetical protein